MKTARLLFICLLAMAGGQLRAHNPNIYSTVITQQHGRWELRLTFASEGLLKALQHYFDDPGILLQDTREFHQLAFEYVQSHASLVVNKHFSLELSKYSVLVSSHATELVIPLQLTTSPLYWEIRIDACREIGTVDNLLRIQNGEAGSLFKISAGEDYRANLIAQGDKYRRVTVN